jgi:hypothetical protein
MTRFQYPLTRVTKLNKKILTILSAAKDIEQHCWWGRKMVQPLWKMVWQLLRKLNKYQRTQES